MDTGDENKGLTGLGPGAPGAGDEALGRRGVRIEAFTDQHRASAKPAFSIRRVPPAAIRTIVSGAIRPRSGDLVLATVDRLGFQTRIEMPSGRKALLHPGDTIMVAYGDRYATDQFEAEVPDSLRPTSLVATGGIASDVLSRTSGMKSATNITPIGLLGDEAGRPINVADYALKPVRPTRPRPRTIAVLGTSMNSGKTTTNRYLTLGLARSGLRVGSAKVTGTGSGGDYWAMKDAGAYRVLDFVDAGFSSTYRIPVEAIEQGAINLIAHLTEIDCDVILLEIADGVFQSQNINLIRSILFRGYIDAVLFAAGEALGAARGLDEMHDLDIPVIGLSGRLTGSELLIREARKACNVPIYTKEELSDPVRAREIVGLAPRRPDPPKAPDPFGLDVDPFPSRTVSDRSGLVFA